MNKTIRKLIEDKLFENLLMCTQGERQMFKRMYSSKGDATTILNVIENIPDEKLDWAFSQVERTLNKNNNDKFHKEV